MGALRRSYIIDGERFEVYEQRDDGSSRFQLFDQEGLPLGDPFAAEPNSALVAEVVRAVRDATEPAA
jgi:hypothetical protein